MIFHSPTSWDCAPLEKHQLCSYSKTTKHFMEPKASLLLSKKPSTGAYPEPHQSTPFHSILLLYNVSHIFIKCYNHKPLSTKQEKKKLRNTTTYVLRKKKSGQHYVAMKIKTKHGFTGKKYCVVAFYAKDAFLKTSYNTTQVLRHTDDSC
jgi:hypothetical protein